MIVYICGPITGLPDGNRQRFKEAQDKLLELGHHPINPHNVCREVVMMHEGTDHELWVKCMKRDIPEMLKADAVLLLDGWQKSEGAKIERNLANELGIMIIGEAYMFDKLRDRPTRAPEPPPTAPDSRL